MLGLEQSEVELKEQKYSGFACPQAGLDEKFLESLAVTFSRKTVRRFLERYAPTLNTYSTNLVATLESWLLQESSFETVWDISLGNILACLQIASLEPAVLLRRAAELALRLAAFAEGRGRWQINLLSPVRLRLAEFWLPLADSLTVEAGQNYLNIMVDYGSSRINLNFRKTAIGWYEENNRAGKFLFVETVPARIKLWPGPALFPEEIEAYEWRVNETTLAMRQTLQSALEIIHNYSPLYLPWVERVIRTIVPGCPPNNYFVSGSVISKPGVISASINIRPVMLAELLVHESTHQYMHLLSRFGPLDDGRDSTLYYSPVKKTGRPISAIALSYHAFANIILFYRLCQANGLDDAGYCARSEKPMLAQLAVLEQALRTSRALTAPGRALWEPLAERLKEA